MNEKEVERVDQMKSQRFRPLIFISVFLIFIETLIILLAETIFIQFGLVIVGLSAALVEMFYENAGVKQGSWEFHDSSQKIGQLSIEFIPIASCGSVIAVAFVIWQGSTRLFPFGGIEIFLLYSDFLPIILGSISIITFVIFSWIIFIQHKKIETLWLVIPLFLTGLSLLDISVIRRIVLTMTLIIYLSSILEYFLLKQTSAYTYIHGYRPAVTSVAYAFFTMACFFILVGDQGSQIEIIWSLNPLFVLLIVLGLAISITIILLAQLTKRNRSLSNGETPLNPR